MVWLESLLSLYLLISLSLFLLKVIFGRKLGCDVRLVSSQVIDGGRRIQIVLEGFNER